MYKYIYATCRYLYRRDTQLHIYYYIGFVSFIVKEL